MTMLEHKPMLYHVSTIREAGYEAKWARTLRGMPYLMAREPGTPTWWAVDGHMWQRALDVGFAQAFNEYTALGGFFSLPMG